MAKTTVRYLFFFCLSIVNNMNLLYHNDNRRYNYEKINEYIVHSFYNNHKIKNHF